MTAFVPKKMMISLIVFWGRCEIIKGENIYSNGDCVSLVSMFMNHIKVKISTERSCIVQYPKIRTIKTLGATAKNPVRTSKIHQLIQQQKKCRDNPKDHFQHMV